MSASRSASSLHRATQRFQCENKGELSHREAPTHTWQAGTDKTLLPSLLSATEFFKFNYLTLSKYRPSQNVILSYLLSYSCLIILMNTTLYVLPHCFFDVFNQISLVSCRKCILTWQESYNSLKGRRWNKRCIVFSLTLFNDDVKSKGFP